MNGDISLTDVLIAIVSIIGGASIIVAFLQPLANKTKTGIEIAVDLMKELKGLCQGVHLMAIGWEKKVPEILDAAGL